MKYLSLMRAVNDYGKSLKGGSTPIRMSTNAFSGSGVRSVRESNPFQIQSEVDKETGQVINNLLTNNDLPFINHSLRERPNFLFNLPPIMEIEWLKEKLNLTKEQANALEQLSYTMIIWLADEATNGSRNENVTTEYITETFEVDIETLDEVLPLITQIESLNVRRSGVQNWIFTVYYSNDFKELFELCSTYLVNNFLHIYLHLPLLLILFMRDYEQNKLRYWNSYKKIETEELLKDFLNYQKSLHFSRHGYYSYGRGLYRTEEDYLLINTLLEALYNRICELNRDIGLLSYRSYQDLLKKAQKDANGQKKIKGEISLSDVEMYWNEEIERAEAKKKEKEGGDQ